MCSEFAKLDQTWTPQSSIAATKWVPYGSMGQGSCENYSCGSCGGGAPNNSVSALSWTRAGQVGPQGWNNLNLIRMKEGYECVPASIIGGGFQRLGQTWKVQQRYNL